ncbi:inner membrane-spanning protein YciB [Glacieibacterium sp.]|uniref:inner membrane-spanning protein YciB n=1 Tax=Glacieibacterium sp. TaxID=2860237 RepID=UPI003B00C881
MPAQRKVPTGLRLALDYGPLLLFFAASKLSTIFVATGVFMAAVVVAIAVSRWRTGVVSPMLWFTGIVVLVAGGATLYLGNPVYLQMKPTIIYVMMASILLFGLATKRPLLKLVLHDAFPAVDAEGWRKLTRNWALLFIALAVANEVARRMLTMDQWVDFKVWGVTAATFLFAIAQAPILIRHAEKPEPPTPGV